MPTPRAAPRTTVELLDATMKAIGISSDYALAPYLGITRSAISALRNNVAVMGDLTAMRVAELLQAEPAFVLACLHYERAKDEGLRSAWRTVAEQFAPRQSGPSRRVTDWQFDAAGLPISSPLRTSPPPLDLDRRHQTRPSQPPAAPVQSPLV